MVPWGGFKFGDGGTAVRSWQMCCGKTLVAPELADGSASVPFCSAATDIGLSAQQLTIRPVLAHGLSV